MSRDWESEFRSWAKPPGTTERKRCENAERAIRRAINASQHLGQRNISIFAQGSYRNNTNVRRDSDVDICVLCTDTFYYDLPDNLTRVSLGIVGATYEYSEYKNEVEQALIDYFGTHAVDRGNKAIDVNETSYHVEADVAPFFEYRRYNRDGSYLSGVELRTDRDCSRIINWPEQHYSNGVEKNKNTGSRYKFIVRSLKAIAHEMASRHIAIGNIPGFLLECLAYNLPNKCFGSQSYLQDMKDALVHIYEATESSEACSQWVEVNEMKWLFQPEQKWTYDQAHAFAYEAWNFDGLGSQP